MPCSMKFPESLRIDGLTGIPDALGEAEIVRLMRERAELDSD